MKSCRETWIEMLTKTKNTPLRHYSQVINMENYLVETEMFPKKVLEAYSRYNLGKTVSQEDRQHFNQQRGGQQGDYRQGMVEKIANVVDCLKNFPHSKRAIITICNNPNPHHNQDHEAKCMREIHFYLENNKIHGSVFFRAQAAEIFPKNIHFIGSLMTEIAEAIGPNLDLGILHYHTSILVQDRLS